MKKEVKELIEKLSRKRILALYGGRKGHGFWLYRISEDEMSDYYEFKAKNGWAKVPGEIILNDGKRSGNPAFTMFDDAQKMA